MAFNAQTTNYFIRNHNENILSVVFEQMKFKKNLKKSMINNEFLFFWSLQSFSQDD